MGPESAKNFILKTRLDDSEKSNQIKQSARQAVDQISKQMTSELASSNFNTVDSNFIRGNVNDIINVDDGVNKARLSLSLFYDDAFQAWYEATEEAEDVGTLEGHIAQARENHSSEH